MMVGTGSIQVTDLLTGTDRTVDLDGHGSYLVSSTPPDDFRFHTIADTTFILNKSIVPAMITPTASAAWQAIVYARRASWGFEYKVFSSGVLIAYCRTPASVTITTTTQDKTITLKTTDIIEALWTGSTVGNAIGPTHANITGATKANPCVITVASHDLEVGSNALIAGVVGMTELNNNTYEVIGTTPTTISLNVNSTGFTTYTSGGTIKDAIFHAGLIGIQAWATANSITASMSDDVIYLANATNRDIEISDSNHGADLITFGQTINKYEDLPKVCYNGYKVKVEGIDQTIYNDYYVTFEAENGAGIGYGIWKESAGFGVNTAFNPATMPHILTRESDGSFLLQEIPWVPRGSGDDDTNPVPSFIGTEISDILTYQGRLVLISEENVVASVTFDHYNFFASTVTTESADDPIDTASSDSQVTNLHNGLVFNASLILLSDRAQFVHPSENAFTSDTFGLSSKTKFSTIIDCSPVAAATSVFFPFETGQYTGIREMQIENLTGNLAVEDITGHVDHYIDGEAKQLVSSPNKSILVIRTDYSIGQNLYIFQWFDQDSKRKQAAWHKWIFSDTIRNIALIQNKLYLWKAISSGVSLEYIDLSDTPDIETPYTDYPFAVRLDDKDEITGTSDGDYWKVDVTPWTQTRGLSRTNLKVVGGNNTGVGGSIIDFYNHPTDANALRVSKDDLTYAPVVYIGTAIEAEGQITNPYVRTSDGSPKTKGRTRLIDVTFHCSDTGSLDIVIEKDHAPTYTKYYTTNVIDSEFELDAPAMLLNPDIKTAVRSDANKCSIKYYSDSHLPFYISDVDWSGTYYESGRRTV